MKYKCKNYHKKWKSIAKINNIPHVNLNSLKKKMDNNTNI